MKEGVSISYDSAEYTMNEFHMPVADCLLFTYKVNYFSSFQTRPIVFSIDGLVVPSVDYI